MGKCRRLGSVEPYRALSRIPFDRAAFFLFAMSLTSWPSCRSLPPGSCPLSLSACLNVYGIYSCHPISMPTMSIVIFQERLDAKLVAHSATSLHRHVRHPAWCLSKVDLLDFLLATGFSELPFQCRSHVSTLQNDATWCFCRRSIFGKEKNLINGLLRSRAKVIVPVQPYGKTWIPIILIRSSLAWCACIACLFLFYLKALWFCIKHFGSFSTFF
jgi:hypothetical protein